MKRILGILLATVLVLMGCTAQAEAPAPAVTETVTAPAVTTTLPPVTITPAPVTSTITMTPPAEVITVTPSPATITVTPPPVTITMTPAPELPPEPTPTPTPAPDLIIPDLAYVKVLADTYTDDADPEAEGIEITFTYYNSKSEWIMSHDVPVVANLTIYKYMSGAMSEARMQVLYNNQWNWDFDVDLVNSRDKVRIPYENLAHTKAYFGRVNIILKTPKQGKFSLVQDVQFKPYYGLT